MARFLQGNDVRNMSEAIYAQNHRGTTEFIESQYDRFKEIVGNAADDFLNRSREMYHRTRDTVARKAKAVFDKLINVFDPRSVDRLIEFSDIQAAKPLMQRYIIADPEIRRLARRQRIAGWAETYHDYCPSDAPEDHQDYHRITNSLVKFGPAVEENGELIEPWSATTYFELPDVTEEPPLDFIDKLKVQDSIDAARLFLSQGKDCTDPYFVKEKE